MFGPFVEIGVAGGVLLNYTIGSLPGFPYYYNSLVASGITTAFLLMMVWLKETPRWLLSKGYKNEAYQTLIWLRGPGIDITGEIMDIESSDSIINPCNNWKELTARNITIPVGIVVMVVILQNSVGIAAIVPYAAGILKNAGLANPKITAAYVVGGTVFITTFFSIFTTEYFGRKSLLIISGVGMMIGTLSLGTHFYISRPSLCSSANSTLLDASELQHATNHIHSCNPQYAPLAITSIIIYLIAFAIGWGPVPCILLAELLPFQVRGLAGGIATIFSLTTVAIVTFFYIDYSRLVHLWFAWWTFTVVNAVATSFVIIFLRETKGKTLEDIEKYYKTHLF